MTLVELLVGVAVFAVIGLTVWTLTAGAVRAERASADSAAGLRAVQAARVRIEADVRRSRSAAASGSTLELSDRDGGIVRYSLANGALVREAGPATSTVAQGFELVDFAWVPDPGLVRYRLRAGGPGDPVEVEGQVAPRLPPGGRP